MNVNIEEAKKKYNEQVSKGIDDLVNTIIGEFCNWVKGGRFYEDYGNLIPVSKGSNPYNIITFVDTRNQYVRYLGEYKNGEVIAELLSKKLEMRVECISDGLNQYIRIDANYIKKKEE